MRRLVNGRCTLCSFGILGYNADHPSKCAGSFVSACTWPSWPSDGCSHLGDGGLTKEPEARWPTWGSLARWKGRGTGCPSADIVARRESFSWIDIDTRQSQEASSVVVVDKGKFKRARFCLSGASGVGTNGAVAHRVRL